MQALFAVVQKSILAWNCIKGLISSAAETPYGDTTNIVTSMFRPGEGAGDAKLGAADVNQPAENAEKKRELQTSRAPGALRLFMGKTCSGPDARSRALRARRSTHPVSAFSPSFAWLATESRQTLLQESENQVPRQSRPERARITRCRKPRTFGEIPPLATHCAWQASE